MNEKSFDAHATDAITLANSTAEGTQGLYCDYLSLAPEIGHMNARDLFWVLRDVLREDH